MGKKIQSEKESRVRILSLARHNGCEQELLTIFNRYDNALKGCKTQEEKEAIGLLGIMEINKLFGGIKDDLEFKFKSEQTKKELK